MHYARYWKKIIVAFWITVKQSKKRNNWRLEWTTRLGNFIKPENGRERKTVNKLSKLFILLKLVYNKDDRYSGLRMENLDDTLALFGEHYKETGVSTDVKQRAYSIFTKNLSLQHSLDALQ